MTTPPTLSILQWRFPEAMNCDNSLHEGDGRGNIQPLAHLSMKLTETPKVVAM